MLVISDNLNVAHRSVLEAIEKRDGGSIRELAHKVSQAGADVIDLNIGTLTRGAEEIMAWLVDEVQAVTDVQLSLDAHTVEALMAGAARAKKKPIINSYYVQSARPDDVAEHLLPFVADQGLEVILCTIDAGGPSLDPDQRGSKASELVEAALAAGIPSESILIDPVVVHLSGGATAQEHAAAVMRDSQAPEPDLRPSDQDGRRGGIPLRRRPAAAPVGHRPRRTWPC